MAYPTTQKLEPYDQLNLFRRRLCILGIVGRGYNSTCMHRIAQALSMAGDPDIWGGFGFDQLDEDLEALVNYGFLHFEPNDQGAEAYPYHGDYRLTELGALSSL